MFRVNGRNELVNWMLCPIMVLLPGAQAVVTCGAVVIAGLILSIHEAKRVRDMREYPFWARTE